MQIKRNVLNGSTMMTMAATANNSNNGNSINNNKKPFCVRSWAAKSYSNRQYLWRLSGNQSTRTHPGTYTGSCKRCKWMNGPKPQCRVDKKRSCAKRKSDWVRNWSKKKPRKPLSQREERRNVSNSRRRCQAHRIYSYRNACNCLRTFS